MATKRDPAVPGGDRRAMIAATNRAMARTCDLLPAAAAAASPVDSTSASIAADARWEPALERIRALIAGPLSELKFLDAAIRAVVDVLNVPYGKILTLEPSAPWLTVQAGVGWQPGTVGQARVPLGSRSQAGLTLRLGSPVVCSDLPRTRRFADATLLRRHDVVSGVSAVIGAPERPFGILSVHTTKRRDFTPSETRFLCHAADLVAAGISQRRQEPVSAAPRSA